MLWRGFLFSLALGLSAEVRALDNKPLDDVTLADHGRLRGIFRGTSRKLARPAGVTRCQTKKLIQDNCPPPGSRYGFRPDYPDCIMVRKDPDVVVNERKPRKGEEQMQTWCGLKKKPGVGFLRPLESGEVQGDRELHEVDGVQGILFLKYDADAKTTIEAAHNGGREKTAQNYETTAVKNALQRADEIDEGIKKHKFGVVAGLKLTADQLKHLKVEARIALKKHEIDKKKYNVLLTKVRLGQKRLLGDKAAAKGKGKGKAGEPSAGGWTEGLSMEDPEALEAIAAIDAEEAKWQAENGFATDFNAMDMTWEQLEDAIAKEFGPGPFDSEGNPIQG